MSSDFSELSWNANPVTAEGCAKINIPKAMSLKDANKKITEIQTTLCGSAGDNYKPEICQSELTYWGTIQRCLMLQK